MVAVKVRKQTRKWICNNKKLRICDMNDFLLSHIIRIMKSIAEDILETITDNEYSYGLQLAQTLADAMHESFQNLSPVAFATKHCDAYKFMLLEGVRRGLELTQEELATASDVHYEVYGSYLE